jgi:hypothetical protein
MLSEFINDILLNTKAGFEVLMLNGLLKGNTFVANLIILRDGCEDSYKSERDD